MKTKERTEATETKLSYAEFVLKAIERLHNSKSKGIHSVYSGFNSAFRSYYRNDPVHVVNVLAEQGIIKIRPVKGGVMIYKPEDFIERVDSGSKALGKMGLV